MKFTTPILLIEALWSFKASKTLLGIETMAAKPFCLGLASFKASKTLLGIETIFEDYAAMGKPIASKPLKPF